MLVFEFMKNGDVYQYLKFKKKLDLTMTKRFFNQIVYGLYHCHNELNIAMLSLVLAFMIIS